MPIHLLIIIVEMHKQISVNPQYLEILILIFIANQQIYNANK